MGNFVMRIKHILKKDKIIENYTKKNRFIPREIYMKLKSFKTCKLCPSKKIMEIHHIIPVSKGGKNEFRNLIVVCKKCHGKIHATIDDTFVIVDYKQFKIALRQLWLYIKQEIVYRVKKIITKKKRK